MRKVLTSSIKRSTIFRLPLLLPPIPRFTSNKNIISKRLMSIGENKNQEQRIHRKKLANNKDKGTSNFEKLWKEVKFFSFILLLTGINGYVLKEDYEKKKMKKVGELNLDIIPNLMKYGIMMNHFTGEIKQNATQGIVYINNKPMRVQVEDYTKILNWQQQQEFSDQNDDDNEMYYFTRNQNNGSKFKYKNLDDKMMEILKLGHENWFTRVVSITDFNNQRQCDDIMKFEKSSNNSGLGSDQSGSTQDIPLFKFASQFLGKISWIVPADVIYLEEIMAKNYLQDLAQFLPILHHSNNVRLKRYTATDSAKFGTKHHHDDSNWTTIQYLQSPEIGGSTDFEYLLNSEGKSLKVQPTVGKLVIFSNYHDHDDIQISECMKHRGAPFKGNIDKVILQCQFKFIC
jgi:hypothetical protein